MSGGAALPTARIEAFSDGVFGVIMTLLVIDIRLPVVEEESFHRQVPSLLLGLLPKVVSYVISFLTVAVFWISHYRLFHTIRRSDGGLLWINTLFLMLAAFIPFPTGLMGEHPGDSYVVALYGTVLMLCALTFNWMRRQARSAALHHRDLPDDVIRAGVRKSWMAPVLYLVGTLAGLQLPIVGITIFALTPLLYVLPGRFGRHSLEPAPLEE